MTRNDLLLKAYHLMPGPTRSVVASLRGYHLRSWRYGLDTEELVQAAIEREHWSAERWTAWRDERMAYLLHRAATQVPYYKEHWLERRRNGDRAGWEYLENWPCLEKEHLRQNPSAFVASDCNVRRMFHESTSGTSGKALDLWWSPATVRAWYALYEARCRLWYGVSRHDRWAMLGGQLVTPINNRRPPFWVWNKALNQLYMSSYHLAPDLIPFYLDALCKYQVKCILVYPSSIYAMAREVLRMNRRDLKVSVAITNAEPLFKYQRQVITEAFHCPVYETYGMTEIVATASECKLGQLHQWPEIGLMEVFEGEQPIGGNRVGDFVCTGLLNADMPLIRYRVGDRGTLSPMHQYCACGRTLPMVQAVEGRSDDTLYTADGRSVGRLDPVFKGQLQIREAQIIQETLARIRVRFVTTSEFTTQTGQLLVSRLQARMGNIEVLLEEVDRIPRTANGKFRAVVCSLSKQEREQVRRMSCV